MLCCLGSKWNPVDCACLVELCPSSCCFCTVLRNEPKPSIHVLVLVNWSVIFHDSKLCVIFTSLLTGTRRCLLRCPESVQTIDNTHIHWHTHTNKHDEHSHVHQAFGSRAAWQPGSECVKHKPSLIFDVLETNPFGKQWKATAVCFVPSELLIMLCLKSVQRVLMRTSETRN